MTDANPSLQEHEEQPRETPQAQPAGRPLTLQIAAYLSLALLPLGLIAVIQSLQSVDAARDAYRASLTAQTVRAARPESEAILRAFGVARGLVYTVPELLDDPVRCAAAMARVADEDPRVAFAGFVDMDQTTICNSVGERYDFSENPESDRIFAAGVDDVTFSPSGDVTKEAVVVVSVPVRAPVTDALEGFVSLSFASRPLVEERANSAQTDVTLDAAVTLATFDSLGRILTSDIEADELASLLPEGLRLDELIVRNERIFTDRAADGTLRDYAVAPILPGQAYAIGIWETPDRFKAASGLTLRSVAFPVLMWLASLVVAIWSLRRLVIGPVRRLSLRMRAFADRRAMVQANTLAGASLELQEIGASFETMADKIVRDEAELEDRVHERDVLLREVHHRVKNNLQLMSSIINMQIRQSSSAEAEDALRRVQGRLTSLARFHQDLYETSSLSQLRADQLLEDLARQMVSMSADPNRHIDLRLDLDKVVLPPDMASPLAMLVTEAMTNALKYAGTDDAAPVELAVKMTADLDDDAQIVTMEIANSVPNEVVPGREGLGTRLIRAFASQLGAELDMGLDDGRHVVGLRFKAPTEGKLPGEPDGAPGVQEG